MITYNITTNFGAKDTLPAADPDKVVQGAEHTTEYESIKAAFALAAPTSNPVFTGTVTAANVTATGTVTFAGATVADGGSVTTVDINGGTIDGAAIGGSTPAAGAFTTLTATGDATVGGDVTSSGQVKSEGSGAAQGFVGKSLDDSNCFWFSHDSSGDAERAWHVSDDFVIAPDITATRTFARFQETEISLKTNNAAVMVLDTNGNVLIRNIPTSSAGLASDTVWSDGGTLKIIP